MLNKTLSDIEKRCRRDASFIVKIQELFDDTVDEEFFKGLISPVLQSLWDDLADDLKRANSRVVEKLVDQVSVGIERLAADQVGRERTNAWLREKLKAVVLRNHGRFGDLVEERLREYSDDRLVEMIENRIGDDLNWIRINGACVGGAIGLLLHAILLGVESL